MREQITKEFIRDVMDGVLKYLGEQGFHKMRPGYGTGSVGEKFYYITDKLKDRDPSKSRFYDGGIGRYELMVRENGTRAINGFEVDICDEGFSVGGHTTGAGGRKLRLTAEKALALGIAAATAAVKTKVGKKLDELTTYCAQRDLKIGAEDAARKAITAKLPEWNIDFGPYGLADKMYRVSKDSAREEVTPAHVDKVVLEVAVKFADAAKSDVLDVLIVSVCVEKSAGLTRRAMYDVLAEITF